MFDGRFIAGALALAVGITLFFGGIGFVVRDDWLGWAGIFGGPAPLGLGYWLIDRPKVASKAPKARA